MHGLSFICGSLQYSTQVFIPALLNGFIYVAAYALYSVLCNIESVGCLISWPYNHEGMLLWCTVGTITRTSNFNSR